VWAVRKIRHVAFRVDRHRHRSSAIAATVRHVYVERLWGCLGPNVTELNCGPVEQRAKLGLINVTHASKGRIVVAFNRDHESETADPENRARQDVFGVSQDVASALTKSGFEVQTVGVTDDVGQAVNFIAGLRPDAVFNLCESFGGQGRFEAVFPLLLDLGGLSFTGSTAPTLMLSVFKDRAKQILQAAGVSTPLGLRVDGPMVPEDFQMPGPMIVKPSREDASVGISQQSVVRTRVALNAQVQHVWERYKQPVLVEQFIEGREIYVGKLDEPKANGSGVNGKLLPLFEVDFSAMPADRDRIVTFDAKWVESSSDYRSTPTRPATDLSPQVIASIEAVGRAAFAALDLRDYGRVDIRLGSTGEPFVIDVNPNCDLSPTAGFARAALVAGMPYEAVIAHIAHLALARKHAHTFASSQRP
jgi:D-alanine-D-alanine ligase